MRALIIAGVILLPAIAQAQDRQAAEDDAKCRSYGLAFGTAPYADCRMKLETNRSNVEASERFGRGPGGGGLIGAIKSMSK